MRRIVILFVPLVINTMAFAQALNDITEPQPRAGLQQALQ